MSSAPGRRGSSGPGSARSTGTGARTSGTGSRSSEARGVAGRRAAAGSAGSAGGSLGAGRSRAARAAAPRRTVHATRQPDRPSVSRPVATRPGNAPGVAGAPPRRSVRTPAPKAGRRRSARQIVLSPLARQIAAIGLALCAVALSLAYPLRGYLDQQAAERAAVAQQAALADQITTLEAQQAALEDPAYIKAEAKRRLQYVSPGDTVYVVKVPAASAPPSSVPAHGGDAAGSGSAAGSADPAASTAPAAPWYAGLWDTLAHGAAPAK